MLEIVAKKQGKYKKLRKHTGSERSKKSSKTCVEKSFESCEKGVRQMFEIMAKQLEKCKNQEN